MTIYKITNKLNNKVYIGKTINFKRRIDKHKRLLNNKKHHNRHLQNAWNTLGESNFTFEEIAKAKTLEELNTLEVSFISKYNSLNEGYNMTSGGDSGISFSKDVLERMSKSHLGVSLAESHKKSISDSLINKNRPENVKNKISKSHQGKVISPEHRAKISASLKGRTYKKKVK